MPTNQSERSDRVCLPESGTKYKPKVNAGYIIYV